MIWIVLFLPVCIWLGIAVVSELNLPTIMALGTTVIIYLIIELRQVSRDRERSRLPLWIMFLMLVSVVLGAVL
ncbi:MAG: hypothetical protein WAR22_08595 [Desulfomonilia bacterium]|jgi:hypothetical protein